MNSSPAITSNPAIPLTIRRKLGTFLVKRDGGAFSIEIDGREFSGTLDNYIEWMVLVTGNYFEYTYLNLVKSLVTGGTALDIGANVGNHTHAFSGFFDQVISFEPFAKVADRLVAKAAKLPNVTVCRVALSDKNDVLKFSTPKTDNLGAGKIDASGEIEVPVAVGDEFIADKCEYPINFIKIDVEGHELHVLAGLRDTIHTHRPVVMFEVPDFLRKEKGRSISEAFDLFPEDYEFVALKGQSTFPIQTQVARVSRVNRNNPSTFGKVSYAIGYGPERGFVVEGNRIRRSN